MQEQTRARSVRKGGILLTADDHKLKKKKNCENFRNRPYGCKFLIKTFSQKCMSVIHSEILVKNYK